MPACDAPLPGPRMRPRVAAALALVTVSALAIGWAASSALGQATGFEIGATLSERIDVTDERTLSNTGFVLTGVSETRRERLDLAAGANLILDSAESDLTLINPNLRVGYRRTGPRTTFRAEARAVATPVAYTELEGTEGERADEGLRQTVSASVGLDYALGEGTVFQLSGEITDTEFDETAEALVPSTLARVGVGLRQRLTERVETGLRLRFGRFEAEGSAPYEADIWDVTADLAVTPVRALRFAAELGLSQTEIAPAGGGAVSREETALFALGLDYALAEGTTLRARLTQAVEPDTDGELSVAGTARLGLEHALGPSTGLSLALSAGRREAVGGGETTETQQLSAGVSQRLGRLTEARLGYTARRVTGEDLDHRLTVEISRRFNLLP